MQFKVPQNVQRADKIVGPLTLRQLIIVGVGFMICYAIFTLLGREYTWITVAIFTVPFALITLVFAFINPLGLAFEKYLLYALEFYFILPQRRYWLKGTADPSRYQEIGLSPQREAKKEKTIEKKIPEKSIDDLSQMLNK